MKRNLTCRAPEYPYLIDLIVKFDRITKQGQHLCVKFVVPGLLQFEDERLKDLLQKVGLVQWNFEALASPFGQSPYF